MRVAHVLRMSTQLALAHQVEADPVAGPFHCWGTALPYAVIYVARVCATQRATTPANYPASVMRIGAGLAGTPPTHVLFTTSRSQLPRRSGTAPHPVRRRPALAAGTGRRRWSPPHLGSKERWGPLTGPQGVYVWPSYVGPLAHPW